MDKNPAKKVTIDSQSSSSLITSSKDGEDFSSFKTAIMNENLDILTYSGDYYIYYKRNELKVMKPFISDLMHFAGLDKFLITSVNRINFDKCIMPASRNPLIFNIKVAKQLQDFLYNLFKQDNGNFLLADNNLMILMKFLKQLMTNGWDSLRLLGTLIGMKMVTATLYIRKNSSPPRNDISRKFETVWSNIYSSVIRLVLKDCTMLVSFNILREFEFWSIHFTDILKLNNIIKYITEAILSDILLIKRKGYEILLILAKHHAHDEDFLCIFQLAKKQLLDCLEKKDIFKEISIAILYYLSRIKDKLYTDSKEIELWYTAVSDGNLNVCVHAAKYLYETHLKGNTIDIVIRNLVQFVRKVKNVNLLADAFFWIFIKINVTKQWIKLIEKSSNADGASFFYAIVKRIVLNKPPEIRQSTRERLTELDRVRFAKEFTLSFFNEWFEFMDSNIENVTVLKKLIKLVQFFDKNTLSNQTFLQIWLKLKDKFLVHTNVEIINSSCRMMDYLETYCTWDNSLYLILEKDKNEIIRTMTINCLLNYLKLPLVQMSIFENDVQRLFSVFKYFLFDDESIWSLLVELVKNKDFMNNLQDRPERIQFIMTSMFELLFRRFEDLLFLASQSDKEVKNSPQHLKILKEMNEKEMNLCPRLYELESNFTFILDSSLSYEIRKKCFFYFSRLFRSCGSHACNNNTPLFLFFLNFEDDFPSKLEYVAQKSLFQIAHEGDNTCCEVLQNYLSLIADGLIVPKYIRYFIAHLGETDLHDKIIITSTESMLAKSHSNMNVVANIIYNILKDLRPNVKRGQEILSIMFSTNRNNIMENLLYTVHDRVTKEYIKGEETYLILFLLPSVNWLTMEHKCLLHKEMFQHYQIYKEEVQLYLFKLHEIVE